MAADRGGLQYTIAVQDQFSAATAKFIAEIGAAKVAFAEFRAEITKGQGAASSLTALTKASKAASAQRVSASKDELDAAKELAALQKRLKFETDEQRKRERVNTRLNAAARRDEGREAARLAGQRAKQNQAEVIAARKLAAEQRKLKADVDATNRRQAEVARLNASARRDEIRQIQAQAAAQARVAAKDPAQRGARAAEARILAQETAKAEVAALRRSGREDLVTKSLKRQSGELKDQGRSANSLLFTFRRLVGVLAAFQIARAVVSGFRNLIVSGIQFNDEIRQAEIGIAGLITGLADVRNEQGNSVGLAEEYARALGVARRQTELLRQDALLTTATFEQLLNTFQIAIGPGFAAGLNLDEIRRLSVSISQAATAIGLPQNQLAEEIRSLLAGTIQARTTRIATALQITNADIRRLKQTGELFTFLETRFKALGLAAEQAARQTLSGIGQLVKDATSAILGQAAQPLFEELIKLGNEVFDQVLTIKTVSGEIKPNPEAVRAFRALFDALREGVVQARELGKQLGFRGLQDLLGTFGAALTAALQFALGLLQPILASVQLLLGLMRAVGKAIGLDVNDGLAQTARLAGQAVGLFLVLRTVSRTFGFSIKDLVKNTLDLISTLRTLSPALKGALGLLGKGGLIGIGVAVIAKGFQKWVSAIFDVNLTLVDTLALLSEGVQSGFSSLQTGIAKLLVRGGGALKKLFSSDDEAKFIEDRINGTLKALEDGETAFQKKKDEIIARLVNRRRNEQNPLEQPGGRPADDRNASIRDFGEIVSNVESILAKSNETFGQTDEELKKLGAAFAAAGRKTGAQGFAGEVEDALADAAESTANRTREITAALKQIQAQFAKGVATLGLSPERVTALKAAAGAPAENRQKALDALELTKQEGQLVNLFRNEAALREQIGDLAEQDLAVARLKVAIAAQEQLPALRREVDSLREQALAEGAITAVVTQRLGARRLAAVEAQNELNIARQASRQRLADIQKELDAARKASGPITGLETSEERAREKQRAAAAAALAVELEKQLGLETAIAAAKEKQLEFAAEQARLAAEGTFTAGLRAGFEQLANDLPTLFEAAKNIIQGITNTFVSFLGQAFRDLFDPRVEVALKERVGELLLDIGQQIFEETVKSLIQAAIQFFVVRQGQEAALAAQRATQEAALAAQRIATEVAIATIRAGAGGGSKGGLVPAGGFARGGHIDRVPSLVARAHAKGFSRGGVPFGRAPGISPSDTVPAWLQPGEFVVRKAVVDSLGADFFKAVNSGDFAPPSRAPSGDGAVGMIRGGAVLNREPARSRRDSGVPLVLPAVVTTEREMDRLSAGGKNANLRFMRDNAGTIRGILGI